MMELYLQLLYLLYYYNGKNNTIQYNTRALRSFLPPLLPYAPGNIYSMTCVATATPE